MNTNTPVTRSSSTKASTRDYGDDGGCGLCHFNGGELSKASAQTPEITIKIVSAEYGPCEGIRLLNGELVNDDSVRIPVTRDVTPFLRALLIAGQQRHLEQRHHDDNDDVDHNSPHIVQVQPPSAYGGTAAASNFIYLLGTGSMNSMNSIFGDPCPGSSKRLDVHYVVTEASHDDDIQTRAAKTEVHRVSFAEHDKVVLRRRLTFYQDDSQLKEAILRSANKQLRQRQTQQHAHHDARTKIAAKTSTNGNAIPESQTTSPKTILDTSIEAYGHDKTIENFEEDADEDSDRVLLRQLRRMGRSQSIAEFMTLETSSTTSNSNEDATFPVAKMLGDCSEESVPSPEELPSYEHANSARSRCASLPFDTKNASSSSALPWRLRSAVSEISLPLILPFLEVRERVQCRMICKSWKHVVRDWGVATKIDSNDPSITNFTRAFLRGLLSHSYSSLHSLFLSGLETLQKDDLHPAIPHLRKLRSFDVSRCVNLDDSTMTHLSKSQTSQTLEVLYIKGLRNVTDSGIQSICRSCAKLEVLDLSYVPVTDDGGRAIQQLTRLKALYLRDNYNLTNLSVDVITEKCKRLTQLTLWGCIRVRHLHFNRASSIPQSLSSAMTAGANLVFLNLWGCHGLRDEAADSMAGMESLRSLIASECHRITDQFVVRNTKLLIVSYGRHQTAC